MNYINLYYQTKAASLLNDEGGKPGFRTTVSTKPMIIGNLKRAIEEDDIWIPSTIMVEELKTYVSSENGSTNALAGNFDDTVMALAIIGFVETVVLKPGLPPSSSRRLAALV